MDIRSRQKKEIREIIKRVGLPGLRYERPDLWRLVVQQSTRRR
jgi:hypothetical protein